MQDEINTGACVWTNSTLYSSFLRLLSRQRQESDPEFCGGISLTNPILGPTPFGLPAAAAV